MQQQHDPYDRRRNRGFSDSTQGEDDLDLEQRELQRRGGARLPLRLWTEGRCDNQLDFHNCSNISETGIFIETPDPYPLGARVEIEFNLPGIHDPIKVSGRVVSVLDADSAGENLMGNGFVFEQIAHSDRDLLRAYVEASRLAR
jgi:Tfp pilus assembly protein PilZ